MSVLTGLVAAFLQVAAVPPPFHEDGRGVFVYGGMVLDFRVGLERMGRHFGLRNCSTQTFFCADGELFNVVVPRFCRDLHPQAGMVWRSGALETTVLGRRQRPEPGRPEWLPPDDVWYIHTNERPEVVFAYSCDRGISRFYLDMRARRSSAEAYDFVAMARSGELEDFTDRAYREPERQADRATIFTLITFDRFAACLPEEFRRSGENGWRERRRSDHPRTNQSSRSGRGGEAGAQPRIPAPPASHGAADAGPFRQLSSSDGAFRSGRR